VPALDLRFAPGASQPHAIVWGGVEEAAEVRDAWERDGRRGYRLALADGSEIEVSGSPGAWIREHERTD
jgi:hypothetical protein